MHPKVTQEIIDAYKEVGVAHVPGVFAKEWVGRMTQVIDSIVAGLRDGSLVFGPHETMRDVEFEDRDGYVRLVNAYWRVPEMQALVEECDCAEVVADVIGSDEMRAWVDGTFLKEGNAEETATPWHNDECLFPFSGEHSPSMWVALTDMGPDNAPLLTLAGSNRDPHRYVSSWALEGTEAPPNFHPWSELLERVERAGRGHPRVGSAGGRHAGHPPENDSRLQAAHRRLRGPPPRLFVALDRQRHPLPVQSDGPEEPVRGQRTAERRRTPSRFRNARDLAPPTPQESRLRGPRLPGRHPGVSSAGVSAVMARAWMGPCIISSRAA